MYFAPLFLTTTTKGVLWRAWSSVSSKFTLLNVLYTGGALLVIGAMTLFMTLGWGACWFLPIFPFYFLTPKPKTSFRDIRWRRYLWYRLFIWSVVRCIGSILL